MLKLQEYRGAKMNKPKGELMPQLSSVCKLSFTEMFKRNPRLQKIRDAVDFERCKRLRLQNKLYHMSETPDKIKHWNIPCYIDLVDSKLKHAVIVLNRPIRHNKEYVLKLWNQAQVTITVDGGTRRWDTFISTIDENQQAHLKPPTMLTGDFDSITTEIMTKYKSLGSEVIYTPDQNATDFTKSLRELNRYCNEKQIMLDATIVLTENSGRIDQLMSNIQTLFLIKTEQIVAKTNNVFLVAEDSFSWLLCEGEHFIQIPECVFADEKPWCSLIPVGEECTSVTTHGLKWDIDNAPLKFGKVVSTSNTFTKSASVYIKNSHPLLWSFKVPSLLGNMAVKKENR